MSRIQLITNTKDDETNKILSEIKSTFGLIPKLWMAYANYPLLLKANWYKQNAVMNKGSLSAVLKQAVALIVSEQNSCEYCVDAHKMMLNSMGYHQVDNPESNLLNDKEVLLYNLAKQINIDSLKLNDKLFLELESKGITIEETLEIIGVVELFVGFNMFLNAMNIPGGEL